MPITVVGAEIETRLIEALDRLTMLRGDLVAGFAASARWDLLQLGVQVEQLGGLVGELDREIAERAS